MKKIFVMAALSLAAISCTKSDVLDSPVLDQEISFNTYLGKAPVSKATIQDNTSVKEEGYSFTVKAIKHWPGQDNNYTVEELSKQLYMNRSLSYVANTGEGETGGSWKYDDTPVYWPTDGSYLRFVAFGNNVDDENFAAKVEGEGNDQVTSNTEFTYTVPANLAQQQDLIVANTEVLGLAENNPAVRLEFKHMLSRIGFSLVSNSNTPVHINWLKLEGVNKTFYSKASIDLLGTLALSIAENETAKVEAYNVITSKSTFVPQKKTVENQDGPSSTTDVNVPIIQTAGENQTADVDSRYLMIIPQGAPVVEGEGSAAVVNDEMKILGEFTIGTDETVRPISIKLGSVAALANGFEAGKAYEFVLNVKTYEISFNVEVVEWDEKDNTFTQEI